MPGFSFVPFTTTISAGGSVIFDFPSEPHNVIFERVTGAPADIQQTRNRRVSRTFSVAGNFPYDCTLHPGMSGVVVVR
jgi:plastocyanin